MCALLAGAIHELAHMGAVYLLGGRILSITVAPMGTVLNSSPMLRFRGALASLAGPMGSLCLTWFARCFPEMAVCGLIQGLFNLLPVYPLDGGRVARCLLSEQMCKIMEIVTLVMTGIFGIWLYRHSKLGTASVFPLAMLLLAWLPGKLSCKEADLAVQ